ncbi:hypothetical protein CMI38_01215 [Candidatus Pacearchaeota archaeon]|nr:hypothetical protein [Candidatus Pacearchaeota archaeon]|tara:strand:- start:11879 stop:13324 length:1446 start_codon:yes stop_codon:yes gene_type:complete
MGDKKIGINRIEVNGLTKSFYREFSREGLLAKILGFSFVSKKKEVIALDNVSFKVRAGENLGIIGKNGSGKSTLLRILAGIYRVDEGSNEVNDKKDVGKVFTEGNVVYLTGFNYGLKKKLSVRDNIYLMGVLHGLNRSEIDGRLDEIISFSGLREYLNAKVYQLSSGMISRLCFSVTINCVSHKNPDIILIDEALGGGADAEFKEKALKKMSELIEGGATVVLVSHNLNQIRKYCDRVILLDDGKIVGDGDPLEVISYYTGILNNLDDLDIVSKEDGLNAERIFGEVYSEGHWGNGDDMFYSGTGSDIENCLPFKHYLENFIRKNNIKTVVDLGCGDFRMGGLMDWNEVNYVGVDVVDSLIKHNQKFFSDQNISFVKGDIINDELPSGDLCILRFVLQHLSNRDILKIISKLKKYKYVIVVDGVAVDRYHEKVNSNLVTGAGIRDNGLHLDLSPFNLNVVKEGEYLNVDGKDRISIVRVFL